MCYHLVHVVLSRLPACVYVCGLFRCADIDARGQTAKHYMNQVVTNKQQLGIPPDDGLVVARNM